MNFCKVKDCFQHVHGLEYCAKHYRRFRKYGNPLQQGNRNFDHDGFCSIPNCNELYSAKGLCITHYHAQSHLKIKRLKNAKIWNSNNKDRLMINTANHLKRISKVLNISPEDYKILLML